MNGCTYCSNSSRPVSLMFLSLFIFLEATQWSSCSFWFQRRDFWMSDAWRLQPDLFIKHSFFGVSSEDSTFTSWSPLDDEPLSLVLDSEDFFALSTACFFVLTSHFTYSHWRAANDVVVSWSLKAAMQTSLSTIIAGRLQWFFNVIKTLELLTAYRYDVLWIIWHDSSCSLCWIFFGYTQKKLVHIFSCLSHVLLQQTRFLHFVETVSNF